MSIPSISDGTDHSNDAWTVQLFIGSIGTFGLKFGTDVRFDTDKNKQNLLKKNVVGIIDKNIDDVGNNILIYLPCYH